MHQLWLRAELYRAYCTVKVMVVGTEIPPPVPFTVMVDVPLVALLFVEIFIVELPLPPEIDDGLKLIFMPLP